MKIHRMGLQFRKRIGLMKSVAIYYWKPFNQRRLRNFYRQFIRPGDLCFDIGAHVGSRTQAWCALGAKVVAVEPQPMCAEYLKHKFAHNPSVTIVEEAVGRTDGEARMYISTANPTISTFSDETWRAQIRKDARYHVEWDTQIHTGMTTIDALVSRFGVPAFCKIDIENAEYEALLGMTHVISALSFEYYPPSMENTFRCLERLSAMGPYEFNWSLGESLRLQGSEWTDMESIRSHLSGYTTRHEYGDIYARIPGN